MAVTDRKQGEAAFFSAKIVVFLPSGVTAECRERFVTFSIKVPQAQVDIIDVDSEEPGPTLYHRGDVIRGSRIDGFLQYAQQLVKA